MRTAGSSRGRRRFLKQLAAVAASAAAATGSPGAIPTRTLGKTGMALPLLGYGGAALPKAWLNPLSIEERVQLVRYAYDRGIRYFDTAGNYMESQPILGEALRDRRQQVCLVTKVETTDPGEVRAAVDKSLKELQTSHVDILLIHGTPGIQQMSVAQAMKIHAELLKLRDQKITRFVGLSAHGYFDKALELISSGGFDVCMLSYGYVPRGYDQIWSARMIELRNACIAKAHALGMGIVAMKVMGAGMLGAWAGYIVADYDKQKLKQLPGAAIRYVLQDQRIQVLNIGMRLKEEIDANIGILAAASAPFSLEDRALLAEFSARLYESDAVRKLKVE